MLQAAQAVLIRTRLEIVSKVQAKLQPGPPGHQLNVLMEPTLTASHGVEPAVIMGALQSGTNRHFIFLDNQ